MHRHAIWSVSLLSDSYKCKDWKVHSRNKLLKWFTCRAAHFYFPDFLMFTCRDAHFISPDFCMFTCRTAHFYFLDLCTFTCRAAHFYFLDFCTFTWPTVILGTPIGIDMTTTTARGIGARMYWLSLKMKYQLTSLVSHLLKQRYVSKWLSPPHKSNNCICLTWVATL